MQTNTRMQLFVFCGWPCCALKIEGFLTFLPEGNAESVFLCDARLKNALALKYHDELDAVFKKAFV